MIKTISFLVLLMGIAACSSTVTKVNERSSDVNSGISALENAAGTVDRAIATEKRIRERFDR